MSRKSIRARNPCHSLLSSHIFGVVVRTSRTVRRVLLCFRRSERLLPCTQFLLLWNCSQCFDSMYWNCFQSSPLLYLLAQKWRLRLPNLSRDLPKLNMRMQVDIFNEIKYLKPYGSMLSISTQLPAQVRSQPSATIALIDKNIEMGSLDLIFEVY